MYLTISVQKMGSTYNSSVGNYVESYVGRKARAKETGKFFAKVMGQPTKEKDIAFKLLKTMATEINGVGCALSCFAFRLSAGTLQKPDRIHAQKLGIRFG